jgi:hypothetical protein
MAMGMLLVFGKLLHWGNISNRNSRRCERNVDWAELSGEGQGTKFSNCPVNQQAWLVTLKIGQNKWGKENRQ